MRLTRLRTAWLAVALTLNLAACTQVSGIVDDDSRPVSDADALPGQVHDHRGLVLVRVLSQRGRPLKASVDITQEDGTSPPRFFGFGQVEGTTNEYGQWFEPGVYTVHVRAPGYRSKTTRPVQVRRGGREVIDVRLTRRER